MKQKKAIRIGIIFAILLAIIPISLAANQSSNASDSIQTLKVSIPEFVNRRAIEISGTTNPFSTVALSVNINPTRVISANEVGQSGTFTFSAVQLDSSNTIRIVSTKNSNSIETSFDVQVDTESPVAKLENTSLIVSGFNLTLKGTVSEPVVVKIYTDLSSNITSVPARIRGINATKITQNAIELKWDEAKDEEFSHYVIYRNGNPISITKPASFNIFTDALVDSGERYTYEISAININGNEGPKSDPLVVSTLSGGQKLGLSYPEIDIHEDFRKPFATFNASGNFVLPLKLNKGDQTYNLKIVFEDWAQNKFTIERKVIIDTKRPTIKFQSPPSGAFVYEYTANEVDIVGVTEPNSKVHLFINRHPFVNFNQTTELSGIPNDILDSIHEVDLDAKCRLNLGGVALCGNSADKTTTADSKGNFKFENIDLTAFLGQGSRITDVPLTEFKDVQLNPEVRQSKKVDLLVIATDPVGLRGFGRNTIRIGTCYSGNQSWDVIPLTQYQSPTFLSTERLAEGTETLYFNYNFSYIGRGTNARIKSISFQNACSNAKVLDSRFNISCSIFPAGAKPIFINPPDNTLTYSAVPLGRIESMDRFLEKDWKEFLKAISSEMTFPILVRINYEHDVVTEDGTTKKLTETQTTCDHVTYVVDNTLIDPRAVLPDWMLYDFVDYLQNSIEALTKVQKQIDRIVDYVGQACLWTYIAHTAYNIYRSWIDTMNENFNVKLIKQRDDSDPCKQIVSAIEQKNGGRFRISKMTDSDLKACFPSSYNAWNNEAKFYEWQRWSCDRIFGHSSPAKWTEDEPDDKLRDTLERQSKCATDNAVQGPSYRAEKCISYATRYPNAGGLGLDEKCILIQTTNNRVGLYQIQEKISDNLYTLHLITGSGYESEIRYAVKDSRSEDYYMVPRPKTCEELCGAKATAVKEPKVTVYSKDSQRSLFNTKKSTQGPKKDGICTTTYSCNEIAKAATNTEDKVEITTEKGTEAITVTSARPSGYTSDCFYDPNTPPLNSVEVVGDDIEQRMECCCVNSKGYEDVVYYQPDDVAVYDNTKKVHESKTTENSAPISLSTDAFGHSDMKWSYRYQKQKFESQGTDGVVHNKYNPNRYMQERDFPACFGQNSWFKGEEVVVLNPFKQHLSSLQCAYIVGINQRLQILNNIMGAMSNCLIEVRQSGFADAGVCKELFTQHVCGAVWQAVRFFIDGCNPEGYGINEDANQDNVAEKVKLGLRGIAQGISESQQEISDEYGNAKLNNLLGIGEGGVARKACLAAFGYDWDLNAKNLVDAAYTSPFATLAQVVTKSREYLTIDPITLKPKYEYRASWLINPGCEFEDYRVELVCVGRKEILENPNSVNCGAVGAPSIGYTDAIGTSTAYNQCDCQDLPEGKSRTFYAPAGRLKQNVLVEKDHHDVIDDMYRYDHIRITLRPDRRIPPNIRQNCFPSGYENGVFYFPIIDRSAKDIVDCSVNPLSGVFSCSQGISLAGQKGTVQVSEITINGERAENVKEIQIGEPLNVGAVISKTGKDKCLRVSISPDVAQYQVEGIAIDGTNEIEMQVIDQLRIVSTNNVHSRYALYNVLYLNNDNPVPIVVQFIDNNDAGPPLNKTYSPDDRVIIDGIEVDLDSGRADFSSGNIKITVQDTGTQKKLITIEKNDAGIEIYDVKYLADPKTGQYQAVDTITVHPIQSVTAKTQPKTLAVEIFNVKDNVEFYGTPDDCNFNDRPIYEKRYTFSATEKNVQSQEIAPKIETIRYNPRIPLAIGNELTITSKITHREGIREVSVTIQDSRGNIVVNKLMEKQGDIYVYRLDTLPHQAGKYLVTIDATSDQDKKSKRTSEFDLKV